LITHLTFKSSPCPKIYTVDYQKPLFIVAGQDTLAGIGNPPSVVTTAVVGKSIVTGVDIWKRDYLKYFVNSGKKGESVVFDIAKFPEAAIDNLRQQKNDELEKIRKNNERRVKEASLSQGASYSRSKAAAGGA
jgi:dynein light intermediate chain 2